METAFPVRPMEPPDYLTSEQAADWRALVGAFPAERFGPDSVPVLVELVRHQAIARQLDENLAGMRRRILTSDSPTGVKQRRMFIQLVRAHAAESQLIAMLSVKLRLADQSKTRKVLAEAERERTPTGPRPWDDDWSRDEDAGKH
jgi:hypothetical protein